MKRRKGRLLLALAAWLVSASCWGTECGFFRIECLDGEAPENLAITMDESGQTFLEFDTVEGDSYCIEATDSLSPPAWGSVWCLTGDGQRAAWLTTSRRWSRTFGGSHGESGRSVQETSDGGYILVGQTNSFGAGGCDVYLVRTDANGNEVWSKTFGEDGSDGAYSVQQTSDGGYIVAGWTDSFGAGAFDVYLIKTDEEGDEVWTRTFGGSKSDEGHSVQQTTDGGYILAGYTQSFGAGSTDVYLVKTDAGGNEVWSRTFGGIEPDQASWVQQTTDGGYIVAGGTWSFGAGDYDVYLIKTDANGDEVWARTFGGSDVEWGRSVQQTSDGGYIVAGHTSSSGAGGFDVYLIKTDANGDVGMLKGWTKTFGGSGTDVGYSVQQTTDSGYILAGQTESSGAGNPDAYLIKTDSDGNEVWSKTFGGGQNEAANSVQQTSDGGYIVAGYTEIFQWDHDAYLIKTDANGNAPPPE